MYKNIELVPASDPRSMKEKLEEMVNNGWGIKGFVSFNTGNPGTESFAVMERLSESYSGSGQEFNEQEPEGAQDESLPEAVQQVREKIRRARSPRKNIDISIGGG